jgi:hypothetical protein
MLHEVHIEKKREQTAGVHGRSSSTNMVPVVLDPSSYGWLRPMILMALATTV